MEQDGHLKSLADRVRERAEQERIQTENVFKEQLQTLSNNLLASSQNELRIMSDAMAQEITAATVKLNCHYRTLSIAYGWAWIRTAITAFAMMFGLMGGGWVLMKGAAYWLDTYRQELAQVKTDLRDQRRTLDIMKDQTWGVTFQEDDNGRFIVLPLGKKSDGKGWMVGKRQAIRME